MPVAAAARRGGWWASVPGPPRAAGTRAAAEAEGVSAEWREGSAMELPLADSAFDVAVCQ